MKSITDTAFRHEPEARLDFVPLIRSGALFYFRHEIEARLDPRLKALVDPMDWALWWMLMEVFAENLARCGNHRILLSEGWNDALQLQIAPPEAHNLQAIAAEIGVFVDFCLVEGLLVVEEGCKFACPYFVEQLNGR